MPVTAYIADSGSANDFDLVDTNIRTGVNNNTWSQTVDIGAADPERTLVVAFCWRRGGLADSSTSVVVTMDGVAMTEIGYTSNSRVFEGSLGLGFWYIEKPTGTSASVQFAVNDFSYTARDMSYACYRIINCDPSSFIYVGAGGSGVDTANLTVASGGYGMVTAISDNDGNTSDFTGSNIVTVEGGTPAGAHAYRIVAGTVAHEAAGADGVARLAGEYL